MSKKKTGLLIALGAAIGAAAAGRTETDVTKLSSTELAA